MIDPIVLVLCADVNFCKQLAVVIASVSRASNGHPHSVFVLHDGYSSDLKVKVEFAAAANVEVVWLEAHAPSIDRALLPGGHAPASLYRLRIEALLPASVTRVLYLDTDTIVRHSLVSLWETDIGSHLVGATRDAYLCWAAAGLPWRDLGMSPRLPYFNAGVLLIPLDRWRAAHVSERAFELTTRYRFQDLDQGALNAIVAGDWFPLDPRWNLQTHHLIGDTARARAVEDPAVLDAALQDPAIVHFCHGAWARPWESQSSHPRGAEWFDLLDSTPWAGWRPRQPGPLRKSVVRARRAASRLTR